MGLLGEHYGAIMGLWDHCGATMGPAWEQHGITMGPFWGRSGTTMGLLDKYLNTGTMGIWAMRPLWNNGATLGPLWGYETCVALPDYGAIVGLRAAMGLIWSYGTIVGPLWVHHGRNMGSLWGHDGTAMGPLWGYGTTFGAIVRLRDHYGPLWD